MSFPKDFMWGAGSSAYQIEGAYLADGKGLSIWDTFSHTEGCTYSNQTGDIACDAYHRFEEDLDLAQEIKLSHYRFSISWPRVFPTGSGQVNKAGLAYYDKVVDGCLARGLEPWITLYHWDLPNVLQENGGWQNRAILAAFAEYAALIAKHFKGRVKRYVTFNEPQCFIGMAHSSCLHAPGIPFTPDEMFVSWHHIMLAHGLACKAIRKADPEAVIGVASTGNLGYLGDQHSPTSENIKSLADATFSSESPDVNPGWYFNHQWFLDPIILGHYPEDPNSPWNDLAKTIPNEELKLLAHPIDFIGINVYNGREYPDTLKYPGYPRTALKWPITPEVIYWGPKLLYERYHLPLVITEDGLSCNDKIYLDGKVHDPDRIDFLWRYLRELKRAVNDNIPIIGYLHWSLTDNFEWHSGYEDRFGLIYIDYPTQKRILKDSAFWYKRVIESDGQSL